MVTLCRAGRGRASPVNRGYPLPGCAQPSLALAGHGASSLKAPPLSAAAVLAVALPCSGQLLKLRLTHANPCDNQPALWPQVAADSKFVDLGADSLDTVEIMMAL